MFYPSINLIKTSKNMHKKIIHWFTNKPIEEPVRKISNKMVIMNFHHEYQTILEEYQRIESQENREIVPESNFLQYCFKTTLGRPFMINYLLLMRCSEEKKINSVLDKMRAKDPSLFHPDLSDSDFDKYMFKKQVDFIRAIAMKKILEGKEPIDIFDAYIKIYYTESEPQEK